MMSAARRRAASSMNGSSSAAPSATASAYPRIGARRVGPPPDRPPAAGLHVAADEPAAVEVGLPHAGRQLRAGQDIPVGADDDQGGLGGKQLLPQSGGGEGGPLAGVVGLGDGLQALP